MVHDGCTSVSLECPTQSDEKGNADESDDLQTTGRTM